MYCSNFGIYDGFWVLILASPTIIYANVVLITVDSTTFTTKGME